MLRLAADENLNADLVRGLLRAKPQIDIKTVQEAGLAGIPDADVLRWCAEQNRVLLTHDAATMTSVAYDRIRRGFSTPGVIEIPQTLSLAIAIEDILLVVECSEPKDLADQVRYLPLR